MAVQGSKRKVVRLEPSPTLQSGKRVLAIESDELRRLESRLDENFETLDDKYSITPLSEETVDSLDDEDRTSEGLIGLAVVTTSEHSVEDAAFANTAVSIVEDADGSPETASEGWLDARHKNTNVDKLVRKFASLIIGHYHIELLHPDIWCKR